MSEAWNDFLQHEAPGGHGARIYTEVGELAESVALYFATGFEAGEPALLVAAAEHLDAFAGALERLGWDAARIEAEARLVVVDARETLAAIIDDGLPSAAAFERVVGGLVDRVGSVGTGARIYGEMVNVLNERGEPKAAIVLEELWNQLRRSRRFSLLCGYRLDVFDAATQSGTLPEVCRVHSHVLPATDSARFKDAVARALVEVLGRAKARDVLYIVGGRSHERIPLAQDALRWVSTNMPDRAEPVLALARKLYGEPRYGEPGQVHALSA
jgi:hypothetical protein